jgi:hypothetical protein
MPFYPIVPSYVHFPLLSSALFSVLTEIVIFICNIKMRKLETIRLGLKKKKLQNRAHHDISSPNLAYWKN